MEEKLDSGSVIVNKILNGGYEKGIITTFYGPAGSGKTNMCLMAMSAFLGDKKIIYIDTEGSFSVDRLSQITPQYEEIIKRTVFFNPTNFEEQKNFFSQIKDLFDDSVGLVVFDSVAMLYRLEIGKNKDVYNVNRELGLQLSYLSEMARKKNIPILITNQVYSDFENKDKVKMVGGDILKYSSKCLIELKKIVDQRQFVLIKHRSIADGIKFNFKIVNSGIVETIEEEKEN